MHLGKEGARERNGECQALKAGECLTCSLSSKFLVWLEWDRRLTGGGEGGSQSEAKWREYFKKEGVTLNAADQSRKLRTKNLTFDLTTCKSLPWQRKFLQRSGESVTGMVKIWRGRFRERERVQTTPSRVSLKRNEKVIGNSRKGFLKGKLFQHVCFLLVIP